MKLRSQILFGLFVVIVLILAPSLTQLGPVTQFGSTAASKASTEPTIPTLPGRAAWHSFWYYCGQFLSEVSHSGLHLLFGTFTESVLPTVQASAGNILGNNSTLGVIQTSYVSVPGGYRYATSFGTYMITYDSAHGVFVVSWWMLGMNVLSTQVSSTVFTLTTTGTTISPGQWTMASSSASVSQYNADLTLKDSTGKTTLGDYSFVVQFQTTVQPEIFANFTKLGHQTGSILACTDTSTCAYYWDDLGYGFNNWDWLLIPTSGYDAYQSLTKGTVNVSTVSTNVLMSANTVDGSSTQAAFSQWSASWVNEGPQPINILKANPITGTPSLQVTFPSNVVSIDPTFGNGSTGTTAYPRAKTVTATHGAGGSGAPTIDTSVLNAWGSYGGAGKFVAANKQYLSLADSPDWVLGGGTNPFTLRFEINFASLPANGVFTYLIGQYVDADNRWHFAVYNSAGTYHWQFFVRALASTLINMDKVSPGLVTSTWYDLELDRNGSNWYIFQSGLQCGTTTSSNPTLPDLAAAFLIGTRGILDAWFDGLLNEELIKNGVALHTSNFTPPTAPYVRDPYTVLLLHMVSSGFIDDVTTGQALATQFTLADNNAQLSSMSVYSGWAGNYRLGIFSNSGTLTIGSGVSCSSKGTAVNDSCTLTSSPGPSLVIVGTAVVGTVAVSAVTVGGVAATSLSAVNQSTNVRVEVWYANLPAASSPIVTVTFASAVGNAITAQSITNAVAGGSFEGTTTNSGSGLSPQTTTVTVGAGTSGRRIFNAVACMEDVVGVGSVTVAPAGANLEIANAQLPGSVSTKSLTAESNYQDTSSLTAMTTTCTQTGLTLDWATIGTAILVSPYSAPASKLLDCPDTAASATAWTTVNVSSCTPSSLSLSSGSYWLVEQWNPGLTYGPGPSYTNLANAGNYIYQAYGAYPASWGYGISTSEEYSLYATYVIGYTDVITQSIHVGNQLFRSMMAPRFNAQTIPLTANNFRQVVESRASSLDIQLHEALSRGVVGTQRVVSQPMILGVALYRGYVATARTVTEPFSLSSTTGVNSIMQRFTALTITIGNALVRGYVVTTRTISQPFTVTATMNRGVAEITRVITQSIHFAYYFFGRVWNSGAIVEGTPMKPNIDWQPNGFVLLFACLIVGLIGILAFKRRTSKESV